MQITFLLTGKTTDKEILIAMEKYIKRIKKDISFIIKIVHTEKMPSTMPEKDYKKKEGEKILSAIAKTDTLILLDEKGKEYTSKEFAGLLQQFINTGTKSLVFAVGGAYGFSEEVYKRANGQVALSRLTFSHQLVRLILLEQLYRALSIINHKAYHHE